ncbi:MAG: hypothetical protein EXR69_07130 [Myxococcales bacterium]|nr:hypothetical protein [Myxococcales bacterium]
MVPFPMLVALSLVGCLTPTSAWEDPSADDDWSSAVDTPEHSALLDAAGVAAAFDLALSLGFPAPQTVLADYVELMTHTDESCPDDYFADGFLEMGGCTSAEGYTYRGSAGLIRTDTRVTAEDGSWTGNYGLMFAPADYVIIRPNGSQLDAGGNASVQIIQNSQQLNWTTRMTGTFADEEAGGWLAGGYSGDLLVEGHSGSKVEQLIDGSLSVAGAAVVFSQVRLEPDACPDGAVSGTFGIRQSDSTWYEVVLPQGCGSCGAAIWNGTDDVGEVCLDLRPALDSIAILSAP